MKSIKRIIFAALSLLFAAVGCNKISPGAESAPEEESADAVIAGRMIVQLSEEAAQRMENGEDVFRGVDVISAERLYPYDEEWEERHRAWGLHQWYVLDYDESIPSTKAAGDLGMIDGVVYVEQPREIYSTAKVPDDPFFNQQWHYYNDGSLAASYTAGCDINVLPVWNNYTGGSSDVIVAIIDGGIDLSHEDLSAVCIPGGSDGSKNFVDDSYSIVAHDHGTHVAGTVGAINGNGKGVCGVAGGLDGSGGVKLLSCQIFQYDPETKKDKGGNTASAMTWAADHGAVISQNSWGYKYKSAADAAAGGVGSMKTAIDYFIANAGMDKNGKQVGPMAGGVVIFAAGNEGWPNGWPAKYEPVIAVGATNGSFKRSSYSNYGSWVDICAPGGNADDGHLIYSTLPGNAYGKMEGTSMACPHVSGVAALLVSYFGGPGFTNEMLKERLLGGVRKGVVPSNAQIGDLVDALGAFAYGGTIAPEKVSSYEAEVISNNIVFSAVLPSDEDDGKAWGLMFLASENRSELAAADPKNLPSSVRSATVVAGDVKAGESLTGIIGGLRFYTDYHVAVLAYDYNGNYSSISEIVTLKTLGNNPPDILCSESLPLSIKAHESVSFNVELSDPDLHSVSVEYLPGSEASWITKVKDNMWQVSIDGKLSESGVYEALLTARDSYGAESELVVGYEILENHAPEIRTEMNDLAFDAVGARMAIDMEDYIYDPDGERLKYSISISDRSVLHINPKDNVLNLTALDYGRTDVAITASDARGLSCVFTFRVLIRDPESPASIYPSPLVKDGEGRYMLHISGSAPAETYVKISSSSGNVVFEGKGESDAFTPFNVDMTACAAGLYRVSVEIEGRRTVRDIVKL